MARLHPSTSLIVLVVAFTSAGDSARAQDTAPAQIVRRASASRHFIARRTAAAAFRRDKSLAAPAARVCRQGTATLARPSGRRSRIYPKAVEFALRYDEFYQTRDAATAGKLLAAGGDRLDELAAGRRPWTTARGLVVRGYTSRLDESYQPYGLVIPEKLDLSKPVPLYVWLHGRGDKATDLHFIQQRQTSRGQIAPADAIVLHPFGRYCNAFKFAGEVDVFEAIEAVKRNYKIDPDRIVLWGFSMGGAGTWHLAAHYPDRWCAASPGAGFADTRRYQNIQPKDLPPSYEQALWHLYDVPSYNCATCSTCRSWPTAARTISKSRPPGSWKKPSPSTATSCTTSSAQAWGTPIIPSRARGTRQAMADAARKGIDRYPRKIPFQTCTLRYNRCYWVELLGLEKHWEDSRVDATAGNANDIVLRTKNVTAPAPERAVCAIIRRSAVAPRVKIADGEVSLPD